MPVSPGRQDGIRGNSPVLTGHRAPSGRLPGHQGRPPVPTGTGKRCLLEDASPGPTDAANASISSYLSVIPKEQVTAALDHHQPCLARLPRGLVLVKRWLLAILHYIVVGLFTGGGLWLAWWAGNDPTGTGPA
jgi:hypothetical protein